MTEPPLPAADSPAPSAANDRDAKWSGSWLPVVCGVASFPLFAAFFFSLRSLPDLDSYYHLAVARLYASHGIVRALPWARFSILGTRLGDKELLFHLLLIPFASSAGAGRIALALLNATVVAVIGWIGARAAGRAGAFAGVWTVLTAGAFFFRTFRLRPELLALLLLLAFVWLVAKRRPVAAAIVCALFALSYTAWHVPVGIAILIAIATREREDWKLAAAAVAGTIAGIVVHPHFPDNVKIFWIQDVLFFTKKGSLDVGTEIFAPWFTDALLYNLGFWTGLAILVWSAVRRGERLRLRRETIAFAVPGAFFLLLFFFMERMAIYAIPLLVLAALFHAGEVSKKTAVALALCAAVSLPWTSSLIGNVRRHTIDESDLTAFGRALPAGARVAAPWGAAESYCWADPEARYLNVLDPIFMAIPHPREFAAQRALFAGVEPDIPFVAKSILASDFIAFRTREVPRTLLDRLRGDPRVALLHAGENTLVALRGSDAFAAGWEITDPRDPQRHGRYLRNGYVDLTPLAAPCVDASALLPPATYELASYGPASATAGGAVLAGSAGDGAVLGGGTRFALAQPQRVVVRSCRGARSSRNGFYLVRR